VQEALKNRPLQSGSQRYDIVSRVFRLKLAELLADIKGGALGKCKGHIYCVEWQKRGLPHAHILVWLEPEDKLSTPEDYDEVVCAEIPDKDGFPELHALVVEHMIHGPCVGHQPKSPCLKEFKVGKTEKKEIRCGRRFPKKKLLQHRLILVPDCVV
jgi:hypothetical protein